MNVNNLGGFDMKKLSSVFYMWFGFGSAIVSVLAMFLPFLIVNNDIRQATYFFFDGPLGLSLGAWPSFVGFMLILVAGLALGVMALPFLVPSAKLEKIVLISAVALLVVGIVLVSLTGVLYEYLNTAVIGNPTDVFIFEYNQAGYYISLIGAALASASGVVALVLDW
jgi:hypothetical protein